MSFRGINTTVIQIRRQVFTEVARMAYANVKGEQANHLTAEQMLRTMRPHPSFEEAMLEALEALTAKLQS